MDLILNITSQQIELSTAFTVFKEVDALRNIDALFLEVPELLHLSLIQRALMDKISKY